MSRAAISASDIAEASDTPVGSSANGRHQVFISYSSNDSEWMHHIRDELDRLPDFRIDLWVDKNRIGPGSNIDEAVKNGLESSNIAVLLISNAFIASEYIQKNELPWILKHDKRDDFKAIHIPIFDKDDQERILEFLDKTGLNKKLSAISLDDPLETNCSSLQDGLREGKIKQVVKGIRRIVDPRFFMLEQCIDGSYEIVGRVAEGESAVVYRARRDQSPYDYAIKVLKRPGDLSWFQSSLTKATHVGNVKNVIPIFDHRFRASMSYCVLKFIEGERLSHYIQNTKPVSTDFARTVLIKMGLAISEVRAEKVFRNVFFNIRPENILVEHNTLEPYLSLAGRAENRRGTAHLAALEREQVSDEAWAYLVPEYLLPQDVEPDPAMADQYLLGLMGFQLLCGTVPLRLSRGQPGAAELPSFGELPHLMEGRDFSHVFSIVHRMTNLDPGLRFASLDDAIQALKEPERHTLDFVEQSFRRCAGDPATADEFFDEFYRRFLTGCGEAKKLFAAHGYSTKLRDKNLPGKRWTRQRRILQHAILLCLKYFNDQHREACSEPTILSLNRDKHAEEGICPSQDAYEQFLQALLDIVEQYDRAWIEAHAEGAYWREMWEAVMRPGLNYMQSGDPTGRMQG